MLVFKMGTVTHSFNFPLEPRTFLGHWAGYSNTAGTGNVFVGQLAGYFEIGSNRLYIDNSNTSTPLIYREFDNNLLRVNGSGHFSGLGYQSRSFIFP